MIIFNLNHISYINRKKLMKEERIMKKSIFKEEMNMARAGENGILE